MSSVDSTPVFTPCCSDLALVARSFGYSFHLQWSPVKPHWPQARFFNKCNGSPKLELILGCWSDNGRPSRKKGWMRLFLFRWHRRTLCIASHRVRGQVRAGVLSPSSALDAGRLIRGWYRVLEIWSRQYPDVRPYKVFGVFSPPARGTGGLGLTLPTPVPSVDPVVSDVVPDPTHRHSSRDPRLTCCKSLETPLSYTYSTMPVPKSESSGSSLLPLIPLNNAVSVDQ